MFNIRIYELNYTQVRDAHIYQYGHICLAEIEKRLDEVLGVVDVELDARFSEIRTHETNTGNLVCDAALAAVQADAVLINAGILRADCLYAKGPFRQRDLERLLPFQTDLVVVGIKVKVAHLATSSCTT